MSVSVLAVPEAQPRVYSEGCRLWLTVSPVAYADPSSQCKSLEGEHEAAASPTGHSFAIHKEFVSMCVLTFVIYYKSQKWLIHYKVVRRHFDGALHAGVKRMNFCGGRAEEDTLIQFPPISRAEDTQSI